MEATRKVEWENLKEGGYYKIVFKDEESNIRDDEEFWDLFNVYKLQYQPRDSHPDEEVPKKYNNYRFETINLFDGYIGISDTGINKRYVKEIYELSHDDLIFEIIKTWDEKPVDNKPDLIAKVCPRGETYIQLHFKSIGNDAIKIIAAMCGFFLKTYEILPSDKLEKSIMVEIPLLQ